MALKVYECFNWVMPNISGIFQWLKAQIFYFYWFSFASCPGLLDMLPFFCTNTVCPSITVEIAVIFMNIVCNYRTLCRQVFYATLLKTLKLNREFYNPNFTVYHKLNWWCNQQCAKFITLRHVFISLLLYVSAYVIIVRKIPLDITQ